MESFQDLKGAIKEKFSSQRAFLGFIKSKGVFPFASMQNAEVWLSQKIGGYTGWTKTDKILFSLLLEKESKLSIFYIYQGFRTYQDCTVAHTVIARNEKEVIRLVKKVAQDEGKGAWEAAEVRKEGTYFGAKTKAYILQSTTV